MSDTSETQKNVSTSRWIGIAFIIVFFMVGGAGYCPWYMWIVFGLLCLFTIAGENKGYQAVIGIALLIWGTPLINGDSSDSNNYEYSTQSSNSSEVKQTANEKKQIENLIKQLEVLHDQFEKAHNAGRMSESKRISDQADEIYNRLQGMNMTKEQQRKVSNLFAL